MSVGQNFGICPLVIRVCALHFEAIVPWPIADAGPGAHSHPDDHVFYVLTGTLSLFIDDERTDAPRGSYALIPGGVPGWTP